MLHLHSRLGFRYQPHGLVTSKTHHWSTRRRSQVLCSSAAAMPYGHVSQSPKFCLFEHATPPAVVRESSDSGACFRFVFSMQSGNRYGNSVGGVTYLLCCSQPQKSFLSCRICFRSCLPGALLCYRRGQACQSGSWYEAACTRRSLVVLLYSLSPANLPFCSPAPRFVLLAALPAVTSSVHKQPV